MSDEFLQYLLTFCGSEYELVRDGLDEVNPAMIRHWCEALGDNNPAYADAAFAEGGIVAPAAMIGTWTMKPIEPGPADPRDGRRGLIAALDDAGFTGIVATNTDQEYVRSLRPGDRVRAKITVESVAEEKSTALGVGHFFTTRTTYVDADDVVVATERFRMLKFKPQARANPRDRARPAMNDDSAFFWEGCARGELLIQRCASCATLRHPPRVGCGVCPSLTWDTVGSAGIGTVYSFVVTHHPPAPGFTMPYVVALIDLDEGVRMLSNVVGAQVDELHIGLRVGVEFLAVDEALTLPAFRPLPVEPETA